MDHRVRSKLYLVYLFLAVVALFIGFSAFGNKTIQGYAVQSGLSGTYNVDIVQSNLSVSNSTKADALRAIADGEAIMQEMIGNNFTITYVNDSLIQAERIVESLDYANVLNNDSASYLDKKKAADMLQLVNWQNLTYDQAVVLADGVKVRREQAFYLYDSLTSLKKDIDGYTATGLNTNESLDFFDKAKTAFYEDRYEESQTMIDNSRASLERRISENTTLNVLKDAALNIFQRYWKEIIVLLVVLLIIGLIARKRIIIRLLENRIRKMKAEEKAIHGLIKETQVERYRKGLISEMSYRTRIKKYEEKLNKIKETLPVVEERLRGYRK